MERSAGLHTNGFAGFLMIKIAILLCICLPLAYQSERRSEILDRSETEYRLREDPALILMAVALCLFAGLRTSYNDTGNYIGAYRSAPELGEFLSNPQNLNPLKNPLFYVYQSLLKTLGAPHQFLIFSTSVFIELSLLSFLKRYCTHFTFSIFIFFTLGTFCITLAAIKQMLAMSVLALAMPQLEKKRLGVYFFLVFIAMLLHTYAICFLVLPFFVQRPWSLFTWLFVLGTVTVMLNFEEVISRFLDQAGEMGKNIAEYEVFDDTSVNVMRLAVYGVTPLMSLLFRRWSFCDSKRMDHVFAHMSIISLAFMSLGTNSGANMFGRMGNYFELGTIVILPEILERTFNDRSYRFISRVAVVCFLGFFIYANGINFSFDADYRMVDIVDVILGWFSPSFS